MKTKVVHSQSKSAWNIIGCDLGGKYKIASVPYIDSGDNESANIRNEEALKHANFISKCFNNLYKD